MKRYSLMLSTVTWLVLFFSVMSTPAPAAAASQASDIACDVQQGPCITDTADNARIAFEILPRPVTAMSDLTFRISFSRNGKPVDGASVLIDLTMPGMFMGRNRVELKQVATGTYEGHGTITRCMSGSKTWRATVAITDANTSFSTSHTFEVR